MTDVRDHTWSFRRGDWFGVFGARATVVLPPSEKSRVAALWELVDDGAGFDEVLDALISGGLRDLPGFVLVSESDGETKVVIRGAARAHFATPDEIVLVEGEGVTTWVERTLTDVARVRIEVADEKDPDDLVIEAGLVRLATAEFPTEPAVPEPASEPVVEQRASEPAPEPVVEQRAPASVVETPAAIEEPGAGEPVAEAVPEVVPDVVEEPVALEIPVPRPAGDHDGHTRTGTLDPDQFERQHPGIPGQQQAPSVTARPVARLVFSSGETVDVDRAVLVGRAPEARRFTSTDQPRLITVQSPHQEVSSTHLEVRPGSGADHGSAVVTDLGSTNGTLIIQPGLPPEDLKAGIAVQLIPGAVIDLGDGVTIQVVNA